MTDKKQRYIVQIDAYIYADTDKDAIKQANQLARWANVGDNCASVFELTQQDFGKMEGRKIDV